MTDHPDQTKQNEDPASGAFDDSFAEFASETEDPAFASARTAPPAPTDPAGAGTTTPADGAYASPAGHDDIWAGADPMLRAAYQAAASRAEAAEHKLSSAHGRVAAYQRQVNALRHEVSGAQQAERPYGLDELLETERLRAFQEDYAEVAEPILDLLRTQQAQLDRLAGPVSQVEENSRRAFYHHQASILERDHPDWLDYTDHDAFAPWLETQPRHVQEAAVRNAQYIEDAQEVSDVLSRFKAHIGRGAGASATDARRMKQLAASTDVRTRGPQAAAGAPNEFDSAFEHFARQRGRR
jgi:hypothetical protein